MPANAALESIIMLIIFLTSPYDAYHQFALAALRGMSREGRPEGPEMGSFAVMSMIIINVHFTTIYVQPGWEFK